jgi:large subunit ribosomal protein L10e
MAKLRKFAAYRRLERPYTRFSKFRKKSYVRARPVCRVVRFDMGDSGKVFDQVLHLITTEPVQIRDNALESARKSMNGFLEKNLGKKQYALKIRVYPHHVLRENPLASGAGADRMSTGMKHSFGKPIGRAAQARKGKILFAVSFMKDHFVVVKQSLKRASYKLPCRTQIIVG